MRLAVVTYTTDFDHPAMKYLIESMRHWNWPEPFVVGGEISFMGHMGKLRKVLAELTRLKEKGYTHALYTDAWDVVCCGPFDEIPEFHTVKALLSGDAGCWPTEGLEAPMFPEVGTRWKYVNGGGWLGEIDYLLDVVFSGSERQLVNDQWWLYRKWLDRTEGLVIDYNCCVFQCLSQTPRECFRVEGERVVNVETGTNPLLIHGAGGADMSWVPCVIPWRPIERRWVQ